MTWYSEHLFGNFITGLTPCHDLNKTNIKKNQNKYTPHSTTIANKPATKTQNIRIIMPNERLKFIINKKIVGCPLFDTILVFYKINIQQNTNLLVLNVHCKPTKYKNIKIQFTKFEK